ncbi:Retinoic acid induced 16-like protein-domain-containing protein [Lipomyces oligophaga]|uniref:Retinoic acid induced 16-like protein-domain-containing protein n=1 Tax=Lipomyces oligophaga TaxID=45792 RepID=UPI0034CD3C14
MSFWGSLWRRQSKHDVYELEAPLKCLERLWTDLVNDETNLRDRGDAKAYRKLAEKISGIVEILDLEEHSGSQRPCLNYALDHRIFTEIAELLKLCGPVLITVSVGLFSVLLRSSEDELMSNCQVIQSVSIFLKELDKVKSDSNLEENFAEILFSVALRLRSEPKAIAKWITTDEPSEDDRTTAVTMPSAANYTRSESLSIPGPTDERIEDEDMEGYLYELPKGMNEGEITPSFQADSTDSDTEIEVSTPITELNDRNSQFTPGPQTEEYKINSFKSQGVHSGPDKTPSSRPAVSSYSSTDKATNIYTTPPRSQDQVSKSQVSLHVETSLNSYAAAVSNSEPEGNLITSDTARAEEYVNSMTKVIDGLLDDIKHSQQKSSFPLFYFLLDFIHHEGKCGEFARTGILYIIECALPDTALEGWILKSDFGTLMASGLGAVYSQLSRRMLHAFQTQKQPKIVQMVNDSEYKVRTTIKDFGGANAIDLDENDEHLRAFLSYLEFWQDTQEHCASATIQTKLLEKFKILFLQQLLLPTLVESTDVFGSTVIIAVMTYLRAIFDCLHGRDVVTTLISVLMQTMTRKPIPNSPELNDERSMNFNLVSLITSGLESSSQQIVASALRLVSTLVRKHYPYLLDNVFQVTRLTKDKEFIPTVVPFNVYSSEIEFFVTMIPSLDSADDMQSQSYDSYLRDTRNSIESHPFFPDFSILNDSDSNEQRLNLFSHTLNNDDKTLSDLLRLLSQFFVNSVEVNLVLTKVFVELASCGWVSLRSWMLVDITTQVSCSRSTESATSNKEDNCDLSIIDFQRLKEYEDDMSSSDDEFDEYWGTKVEDGYDHTVLTGFSPVMEVLRTLSDKIQQFRAKIPGFDDLLADRRSMLQDEDNKIVVDVNEVAFSSPIVASKPDTSVYLSPDPTKYSLSPIDTQKRAEQLLLSSSPVVASSPTPLRRGDAFRFGVLSRSQAQQLQDQPSQWLLRQQRHHQPSLQSSTPNNMSLKHADTYGGNSSDSRSINSKYLPTLGRHRSTFTIATMSSPLRNKGAMSSPIRRTRPELLRSGSQDSLNAFESLMSSPPAGPETDRTGEIAQDELSRFSNLLPTNSFSRPRINPALSSPLQERQRRLSRPPRPEGSDVTNLESEESDVAELALSGEAVSATRLSAEIRETFRESNSDAENEDDDASDFEEALNATAEEASTVNMGIESGAEPVGQVRSNLRRHKTNRSVTRIELDNIANGAEGYVPTVVQVGAYSGPGSGRSRYVSVPHLLGNIIVFEEFLKELLAVIQVRATLIDKIDYGWQNRSRQRQRSRPNSAK